MMKKKQVECLTSSPKRSFIKATTWEFTSFIITFIAIYLIYGNIEESIKFSIALTIVKIFFLYFHERIWKKTMWGKIYVKQNSHI
jgi:uncharacterized membrane protein